MWAKERGAALPARGFGGHFKPQQAAATSARCMRFRQSRPDKLDV